MSFLLMGFSFLSALIVTGTVAIVVVDMIGMMVWMGIPLNAVSLVNIIMVNIFEIQQLQVNDALFFSRLLVYWLSFVLT